MGRRAKGTPWSQGTHCIADPGYGPNDDVEQLHAMFGGVVRPTTVERFLLGYEYPYVPEHERRKEGLPRGPLPKRDLLVGYLCWRLGVPGYAV